MHEISLKQCANHAGREAVARCPECGRFFCRECVTEHADRVVCSPCLHRLGGSGAGSASRLRTMGMVVQCVVGFFLMSYFFHVCGRLLLLIPDAFHEGTFWDAGFWK